MSTFHDARKWHKGGREIFWCTRTSTNSHSQPQLACRFLLPSKLEVSPGFTRNKCLLPCAPWCSLDCCTPLFTQLSKNRRPHAKVNKSQSGLLTFAHGALAPVIQTVQRRLLKKYQRCNYVSPTILEITGRVQTILEITGRLFPRLPNQDLEIIYICLTVLSFKILRNKMLILSKSKQMQLFNTWHNIILA